MKILVTGADGFVGKHACRFFREVGDEVTEAIGPAPGPPSPGLLRLDLVDPDAARELVERTKPDAILNLAGSSSVGESHRDPLQAWRVNALGPVNLLSAVRDASPSTRILLVGSGELYGALAPGTRASEQTPTMPLSPYASSKLAAEVGALQFQRAYGLDVVLARPFNHLGSGQDPRFVVPSFARQIQGIRLRGARPAIQVGNLDIVRDFLHVLDVVKAYRLLLVRGATAGIYNVCSGVGRTIRSVLDELLALARVDAQIEADPARMRPAEIPSLLGDSHKLAALGWRQELSVSDALAEVLREYGMADAKTDQVSGRSRADR